MPKTLLIDLNGVLNTYSGDFKEDEISAPREGVETFLQKLAQHYKIEIFTVRNKKLHSSLEKVINFISLRIYRILYSIAVLQRKFIS